jgi:isocitrate/isopropylmalate dehydrogenase
LPSPATILSIAEGLKWLGEQKKDTVLAKAGVATEEAVAAVVKEGKTLTYDMVGEQRASPTSKVGDAVRAELSKRLVMHE